MSIGEGGSVRWELFFLKETKKERKSQAMKHGVRQEEAEIGPSSALAVE